MLLRPLLSKLFFWPGALAAMASLWLPDPLAPRVATLALGAAACSLLVWRGWKPASHVLSAPPPAALDDGSMLDAMVQIARCCANAGDFNDALRGVGQIITYELGARNVRVARVEPESIGPAQARLRPLLELTAPPRQRAGMALSVAADAALRERGIFSDAQSGHALAVLASGLPVALLEFETLELSVAPAQMTRLLELMRSELNAVAQRNHGDAGALSTQRLRTHRAQSAAPRPLLEMAQLLARDPECETGRPILPGLGLLLDEVPGAAARSLPHPAAAAERRADFN